MRLKKTEPSESDEQISLFAWAELNKGRYPELKLLNGSMNGVRLTIGQAVKAKRCGMKKGYPDLFLPVKRGEHNGLFIELKVGENKPSPEQLEWAEQLRL